MKKLRLVIATAIFTLAMTMTTMAGEILIAGEERTGQRYETEIANSYGEGEEVEIHLIPKQEHLILKDIEEDSYIVITAFSEDLQKIITAEDLYFEYSQSLEVFYPFRWIKNVDWYIDQILNDYNGIEDPMYEPVFTLSINGENEDIYIKFVDVPLLTDKNEESDKPIASDSNATATDSNASHGSSSGGSSSGGSRKVATDSRNTAGTWVQDSIGWWFKKLDGSYPKNEWVMIKDKWYHFDKWGYMETGWIDLNGVKYFLNSDGSMISNNWSLQDKKWYYFDITGAMQTNSWVKWKDNWYYLTIDGSMAINMATPDGYHVNENGVWIN